MISQLLGYDGKSVRNRTTKQETSYSRVFTSSYSKSQVIVWHCSCQPAHNTQQRITNSTAWISIARYRPHTHNLHTYPHSSRPFRNTTAIFLIISLRFVLSFQLLSLLYPWIQMLLLSSKRRVSKSCKTILMKSLATVSFAIEFYFICICVTSCSTVTGKNPTKAYLLPEYTTLKPLQEGQAYLIFSLKL